MNRTTRGNAQNPWLGLELKVAAAAADKGAKVQKSGPKSAGGAKAATESWWEVFRIENQCWYNWEKLVMLLA